MARKKKPMREYAFNIRCDEDLFTRVHKVVDHFGLKQKEFLARGIQRTVEEYERKWREERDDKS